MINFLEEFYNEVKKENIVTQGTMDMYVADLEAFREFLAGKPFEDVEEKDMLKYIEELRPRYKDNSIARKFSSINTFYKYLLKKRIIEKLPTEEINVPREEKIQLEGIEWQEVERILEVCQDTPKEKRDRLVIKLLTETGLQIGEILGIKVSELQRHNYKELSLIKDGYYYLIEISPKLQEDLKSFIENERNELSLKDEEFVFGGLSRQAFRARFIGYGKKARLGREVSPNMIRNNHQLEKSKREKALFEGDALSLIERIREEYIKIGIGDD
jgi:integrase/recombinase XerD